MTSLPPWTRTPLAYAAWALAALVAAVAGWYASLGPGAGGNPWQSRAADLSVYWNAARVLLAGGDIYAPIPDVFPYIYPPFAALVATPLRLFDWPAVTVVWAVLNGLLCLVVVRRMGVREPVPAAWLTAGGLLLLGPLSWLGADAGRAPGLLLAGLLLVAGLAAGALAHRLGHTLLAVSVVGLAASFANPITWLNHLGWVLPLAYALGRRGIPPLLRHGGWVCAAWLCLAPQLRLPGQPDALRTTGRLWLAATPDLAVTFLVLVTLAWAGVTMALRRESTPSGATLTLAPTDPPDLPERAEVAPRARSEADQLSA